MIVETLLGGALGGALRLAPEFFKLWDRKSEREHELRMQGLQVQIAEKRLEAGMRMADAAIEMTTLGAIGQALEGQGEMAKAGGRIVAGISALVRPLVTYWFVGLYSAHKVATMAMASQQGASWQQVFITTWSEQDFGMLSMVLTFWFLGRVWERRGG